jgi:hypothetical protein
MFRRAWWTRRRVIGIGAAVLVVASAIVASARFSGTEKVFVGQPFDDAKAALRRAGAVEVEGSYGLCIWVPGAVKVRTKPDGSTEYYHVGPDGREVVPPDRVDSYWRLSDGRTVWLIGFRDSSDQPYHLEKFMMWQGWHERDGSNRLPDTNVLLVHR